MTKRDGQMHVRDGVTPVDAVAALQMKRGQTYTPAEVRAMLGR
jgi:hypothetical protein